jgi:hypothetical protein
MFYLTEAYFRQTLSAYLRKYWSKWVTKKSPKMREGNRRHHLKKTVPMGYNADLGIYSPRKS